MTVRQDTVGETQRDHTVATSTINLAPKSSKAAYLKPV